MSNYLTHWNLPPGCTPAMIDALSNPTGSDDIDPRFYEQLDACACTQPCDHCLGAGDLGICTACHGNGFVGNSDIVCPAEGCEDGRIVCGDCDGSGGLPTGDCPECRY